MGQAALALSLSSVFTSDPCPAHPRSKCVIGTQGEKKVERSVQVWADRLPQMFTDVHKARPSALSLLLPEGQALRAAPPRDQGAAGAAQECVQTWAVQVSELRWGLHRVAGSLKTRRPVKGMSEVRRLRAGVSLPKLKNHKQKQTLRPGGPECRPQGPGLVSFRLHCLIQAADLV